MKRFFKALTQKSQPFNDTPLIYLIAIIILSVLIGKEIASGEVYLRFVPAVPLASTKGYSYLGIQMVFLLLAVGLFMYKLRRNLKENF